MIDGIDVSKCEFYCSTAKFHKCDCLGTKARKDSTVENLNCEENPNCYFKQLARAKEKIEKWKHQAELGSDTTDRLSKELQSKEQEYEELKKDCPKRCKSDKYKQALDEIEKLLSDALDTEKTNTDESFENFYKCLDIIKKIKEVE